MMGQSMKYYKCKKGHVSLMFCVPVGPGDPGRSGCRKLCAVCYRLLMEQMVPDVEELYSDDALALVRDFNEQARND